MPEGIIDFYSGFEGESEIRLSGPYTIGIWAGYFSPIMDVLLQAENIYRDSAFGIVAQWTTLTGWCDVDSKKTRVENLEEEAEAFSKFTAESLETQEFNYMSGEWKEKVTEVQKEILRLFQAAEEQKLDVYIEEL